MSEEPHELEKRLLDGLKALDDWRGRLPVVTVSLGLRRRLQAEGLLLERFPIGLEDPAPHEDAKK